MSQRSCAVRGRTLRSLNVQGGKVKALWSDCEVWGGWGLEDDYRVTEDKIGGRQQQDRRNLPDRDDEDRTVVW